MRATVKHILAGAVCATTAMSAGMAGAEDVGTMTMEKSMVTRGGSRVKEGTDIALGDKLSANATGAGIIVFKDQSTARMGPNAVLTIDEFVYDPARRTGTIKLRQTNGLARIYGGQISKRGRSEIRTPHIVLVVRGGIADVSVDDEETIATNRGGIMWCESGNKKRTITKPGVSCVSDGNDLTITNNTQSGGNLVPPAGEGGGSSGGTNFGQANCTSPNATSACRSQDGGLPRLGTNTQGNDPLGGGTPGGGLQCFDYDDVTYCDGRYVPD